MNNALNTMNFKNQNLQPGSAAGRKRQQIIAEVLAPSTQSFLQKVNIRKGMHGLDLGCGTGDVTFQLKTLVGDGGKVTGIDTDTTSIKIASEKAAHRNLEGMVFLYSKHIQFTEKHCYDFVYSRLFLNQVLKPQSVIQMIYDSLKTGGIAIVEDLDFSKTYCFPHCYAFDRYLELYTEIRKRQGINVNIGSAIHSLFQQIGFQNILVQLIRPTFLNAEGKQIASLTLESIAPDLLKEKITTPTELQVLLSELKSFEEQSDTLITLPGIYQVCGYR